MPESSQRRPPEVPDLTRLADLPVGGVARLSCRELSQSEAGLLAAMGLTEGCRLIVRSSGDPCIVEVRSTRIGLARSVAARLLVSRDGSDRSDRSDRSDGSDGPDRVQHSERAGGSDRAAGSDTGDGRDHRDDSAVRPR